MVGGHFLYSYESAWETCPAAVSFLVTASGVVLRESEEQHG